MNLNFLNLVWLLPHLSTIVLPKSQGMRAKPDLPYSHGLAPLGVCTSSFRAYDLGIVERDFYFGVRSGSCYEFVFF